MMWWARRPAVSEAELVDVNLSQHWVPFYLWLRDAVTFHPWEVVSSYELAPTALFVLKKENLVRKPLIRLIRIKVFDWFMLTVILANCVTLAMDSNKPGFPESATGQALAMSNYVFIALFMFEAACKIIALGFVFAEHTYLRSGWNVLDFTVVAMGILELTAVGNYTFIRCFRALRPLRAVTKIESLRIIIEALVRSLPMLGDVVILAMFYFSIFGIACVELFKGKFEFRCGVPDFSSAYSETVNGQVMLQNVSYVVLDTVQICKGPLASKETWDNTSGVPTASPFSYVGGVSWGYACPWVPSVNPNDYNYPSGSLCVPYINPDIGGYRNFDNIFMSFIMVFQHMAAQNWSQIMYDTQAAISWWTWMLHVTMVLIGSYLIVNLTLAVIFINFTKHYSSAKTTASLSRGGSIAASFAQSPGKAARTSIDPEYLSGLVGSFSSQKSAVAAVEKDDRDPHGPGMLRRAWERFRDLCYVIQSTKTFQHLTTAMIVLNAIVLAIIWYNMPESVARVTEVANFFFTMYFFLEMVIKITGLGPHLYASDSFNIFDALVTIVGVLEMALTLAPNISTSSAMSVFRAFRLLRIFRLARSWKGLNRIIKVLMVSLMSVGWLTVLLFLFMFIGGLLGMTFFGYKLDYCTVPGSTQMCPLGMTWRDCPSHFDCYVFCDASVAFQWYEVLGSPYGGMAYCQMFPGEAAVGISPPPPAPVPPLPSSQASSPLSLPMASSSGRRHLQQSNGTAFQLLAQVGKPVTFLPNYDNIYQAMLSIFILITADNWDENMKQMMVFMGPWLACLFTIITMVIGIYAVLNLFLAILLANLDQLVEDKSSKAPSNEGSDRDQDLLDDTFRIEDFKTGGPSAPSTTGRRASVSILDKVTTSHTSFWLPKDMQRRLLSNTLRVQQQVIASRGQSASCLMYGQDLGRAPSMTQPASTRQGEGNPGRGSLLSSNVVVPLPPLLMAPLAPLEQPFSAPGQPQATSSPAFNGSEGLRFASKMPLLRPTSVHPLPAEGSAQAGQPAGEVLEGRALFLLSSTNPFRIFLAKLVSNQAFEMTMLALILMSSLELCFCDVNVEPGSTKGNILYGLDIFFTIAFGIEAIMKILVLGLAFNGPSSYLRGPWNILDIFVVIVGVLVIVLQSMMDANNIVWLRAIRALRALRPLRGASRMDGVRVVVVAMITAIPAIGEVLLVAALFYYIFGVLGVNLMDGLFLGCYSSGSLLDPYYLVATDDNINRSWCDANEGSQVITNSYYHDSINVTVPPWQLNTTWGANGILARFDNVIMSLWVLFQVSSLENWTPIMMQAMDCTSLDEQPLFNANIFMSLYFVVFIILCVFFILNMVIGVSINTFNRMKQAGGKSALLTDSQQEWLTVQRMMATTRPKTKYPVPANILRRLAFRLVISNTFDNFMIIVILANVFTMFLTFQGQSQAWVTALSGCNVAFTSIFVLEMLLKWAAIGLPLYFQDGWCQFDFVVVVVSVVGVIMDYATSTEMTIMPLLRVLRVLRIIKLVPKARGLKLMMLTLLWSLPALLNVATVLLLFMYIYAIIGMNLFGYIKYQEAINNDANFQSFPSAMLLLFRMQTGENWEAVMYDCMILEQCIEVIQTVNVTLPGSNTTTLIWSGTYLDTVADATTLAQLPGTAKLNRCSPQPVVAALYFCTYMMVCVYLVLQLVIAVIIENIETLEKIENMKVSQKHIQTFVETWEELDIDGSGLIDATHLTTLLLAVSPPMGVHGLDRVTKRIQDIVQSTEIPLREQRVHFLETLHALAGRVIGESLPSDEEFTIHDRLVQRLPKDEIPPKFTVGDYYAALYVKTSIRGFLIRAKLKPLFDEFEAKPTATEAWVSGGGSMSYSGLGSGSGAASLRRRLPQSLSAKQRAELLHLHPGSGTGSGSARPNTPLLQEPPSEPPIGSGSWEQFDGVPAPGEESVLGEEGVVPGAPLPSQAAPLAAPLRPLKAQQSLGAVTSLQEMLGGLIGGPRPVCDPPGHDPETAVAPPPSSEEAAQLGAGRESEPPTVEPTAGGTLRHRTSASGRISSSGL